MNDDTLNKLGAVSALSRLVQGNVDVFPELFALVRKMHTCVGVILAAQVRDFDLDITEDGFEDENAYFEDLLEPDGARPWLFR